MWDIGGGLFNVGNYAYCREEKAAEGNPQRRKCGKGRKRRKRRNPLGSYEDEKTDKGAAIYKYADV